MVTVSQVPKDKVLHVQHESSVFYEDETKGLWFLKQNHSYAGVLIFE